MSQDALRRVIVWVGQSIQRVGESESLPQWLGGLFVRVCRYIGILYASVLLVLFLACRLIGEQNITTAFLLFVPPIVWFLPLAVLLPALAFGNKKVLLPLVGLVAILMMVWLDWRPTLVDSPASGSRDGEIRVLTYNRGQHRNESLQPFKNLIEPDIILLQEAAHRAKRYGQDPSYQEFVAVADSGEHTILSRHPIRTTSLVPSPSRSNRDVAARFVVDWEGREISLYSVHLLTPRDVLSGYARGGFLWGILGIPGSAWEQNRTARQKFWDQQIEDIKAVLTAAEADPNPVILAGDFNSPSLGYIHRMITQRWKDAHEEAGNGFGFTFPGVTRNPLSFGGPWMRIDYILFGNDWEAVSCITEEGRTSQHRAVAATLRLR